jgi:hypothetical protein
MGHLNEHFDADRAWQLVSAEIARLGRVAHRAFGHSRQRRLGLRVETSCWALLSQGTSSYYAMAVELSGTGVVLQFFGRERRLRFRLGERFNLHLFVPLVSSPVRATVRSVRFLGDRQAFEFVEISAADRLTLAEHLDQRMAHPTRRTALESARRRSS